MYSKIEKSIPSYVNFCRVQDKTKYTISSGVFLDKLSLQNRFGITSAMEECEDIN